MATDPTVPGDSTPGLARVSRALIYEKTFTAADTAENWQLGDGYDAYDYIEIEFLGVTPSTGATGFHMQVRSLAGDWVGSGYKSHTYGTGTGATLSQTALTLVSQNLGSVSFDGRVVLRPDNQPCVGHVVFGNNYREARARMSTSSFNSARAFFGSETAGGSIVGGTIRVYGYKH